MTTYSRPANRAVLTGALRHGAAMRKTIIARRQRMAEQAEKRLRAERMRTIMSWDEALRNSIGPTATAALAYGTQDLESFRWGMQEMLRERAAAQACRPDSIVTVMPGAAILRRLFGIGKTTINRSTP